MVINDKPLIEHKRIYICQWHFCYPKGFQKGQFRPKAPDPHHVHGRAWMSLVRLCQICHPYLIPPANSLRDFIFIGKVSYLLTWQNGIGEDRFFRADVACASLVGGLSRVSTSQGGPRFWMLVGWRNDLNLFGVFRLFMCGRWPSYVGVIMFIGFVITIASFIFNLHHQSIIFCFLFFKNNNNNKNLSPKVPIYLDLVQLCVVYI